MVFALSGFDAVGESLSRSDAGFAPSHPRVCATDGIFLILNADNDIVHSYVQGPSL